MSDERFNHDLLQVLREAAGEEAPMSLRSRLASITDEAPVSRRLWFSPPMRLSVAVVSVVAVLALAFLLTQRGDVGPGPSQSPSSPTPSAEQSSTPKPSTEPTPIQPPIPVDWTGLEWSGWVLPIASQASFITDLVPWEGGYVGVGGSTRGPTGAGMGVFFTSSDGLHWDVAFEVELPEQDWYLVRIVRAGDGMLAMTNVGSIACSADVTCPPEGTDMSPRLWYSDDGISWEQIGDPVWRAALGTGGMVDLAGSPLGVVAVNAGGDTVVSSPDGRIWHQSGGLPASVRAIIRDVAAADDGFVIVGRDGERDRFSQVSPQPAPGVGRPAAWVSSDGVSWSAADVDGAADVPGGELRDVAAAAGGFFATGIDVPMDQPLQDPVSGWSSADGTRWTLIGKLGTDLPWVSALTGDGTHMVILGPTSTANDVLAGWISTTGAEWSWLVFSGASDTLPGAESPEGISIVRAWVVPGGVILQGTGEYPQLLWFGAARGS